MSSYIPCTICAGRGVRPTVKGIAPCGDCEGSGRVKHCVACGGRGKLWMGADEYIDCPVCPSTRGGAAPKRDYFFLHGVAYAPYKPGEGQ